MSLHIEVDRRALAAFCRRWMITELAFFGSVLRDDFGPDSDVDVLVTFSPGSGRSLFERVEMRDELSQLLGRPVDLVSRRAIEDSRNWIRREAILGSAETFYAA
jgi:uncharacterized protein